ITERKRIEETLRASEADFHAFFETIGDMVFVGDRTGRILFTNSAAARLLGYTREELLKMRIADLHPAGTRTEAESILTSMLRNECSACSLPLARKDGAALAVETRVWSGKWNGEDCVFGLSKDLSAEQEATQRFERLFRNNPALMAITTLPDRRFYDCNESFLKTLGYSREEVTGRTSEELGLFPDPDGVNAMSEKLMADESVSEMELQVRRKDGKVLRGLFSGEMIRNQGKSFLLTVMVDITERTSAERALKEAVAKLTVLMDNIQSGVLLETPTRKVLFANHKLCEMFSIPVPPETLIGTDCVAAAGQTKELMEDPEAFIKYLDSTLAAGKTAVGNELRLKDGRVLSQDYVPILLENGTFIGHMWKYTDITAAKRLESLKAEVVHHVNHELRRPITNQVLALEYLMEDIGGTLSPDNLKIFTAALSAARSMTRMVSDLLDVTRSETGKLSVRIEPVDLEELARDLVSGLGPSARENGLDLKLDIPPGLPKAAADLARVRQIVGNLTDNAFKFTSSGGSVSIIIRTAPGPGESLEVSVSDTGQGMEKEELGHIFDRLYQASSISRKGMKGLGLGLHICKTLVEQQGGSITVESEKGRGTTFRFTLPVWKDRQ
ncbi:MAG TPA: PAS domain-containing sensor histidine kinase, partial [Elusimicrobiales bacterium]|nr:PAS domain-containing sensor histidine kinase [Elusimicrobiales bacterium]